MQRHPHGRQIRCQPGRHHQPPNPKQLAFRIGVKVSAPICLAKAPAGVAASALSASVAANAIAAKAASMSIRFRNRLLLEG
jgi:hypothetical protein